MLDNAARAPPGNLHERLMYGSLVVSALDL